MERVTLDVELERLDREIAARKDWTDVHMVPSNYRGLRGQLKGKPMTHPYHIYLPDWSGGMLYANELIREMTQAGIGVILSYGFSGNWSSVLVYEGIAVPYGALDVFDHLHKMQDSYDYVRSKSPPAHRVWGPFRFAHQAPTVAVARAWIKWWDDGHPGHQRKGAARG